MSAVLEIEQAVSQLPPQELARFREWFEKFDAELWDRQFEEDAKSGKLDKLANQAIADCTKNYEALRLTLILGIVRQVTCTHSGVGRQELQIAQDKSASSLVTTQKGGQVLVGESRSQISCSGSRDSRGTTLVLDWDTCRIRPCIRMTATRTNAEHTHADNAAQSVGWASRFAKEQVAGTSSAALRRATALDENVAV